MIRCIAIDDEPIALSIIREYCSRYGGIELECHTSPVRGMERVAMTLPDIVFLDIELTSHNGLELARRLPEGTALVFTTAYSEYALDGFNADAVDFLQKPIFYPRFVKAMEKAKRWISAEESSPDMRRTITLKAEHKNVVVDLDTVKYVEAMDNYVKIYRRDLPTVVSQITMKELKTLLPSDRFIRVHRSFIVPLDRIHTFSNRKIYLRDVENPIPVGRTYNDAIRHLHTLFRPDSPQSE